jgi:hypothetical protein
MTAPCWPPAVLAGVWGVTRVACGVWSLDVQVWRVSDVSLATCRQVPIRALMKPILKNVVGWNHKSETEKVQFLHRFERVRYRSLYLASFVLCLFPIPLRLILRICLSDKHQPSEHQYGYAYGELFWRFKYLPIKLLEIGVGGYADRIGGESLNAWQCYFPFATVVACDIKDKKQLAAPRTRIYQLDQSSTGQLEDLRRKELAFDIIIDDGSHLSAHQILTFRELFPALKPGGLYIIEDVQTSYWSFDGWDGAPVTSADFQRTCVGYFLRLASYINRAEFTSEEGLNIDLLNASKHVRQIIFEHNLIIIKKAHTLIKAGCVKTSI